MKLTDLRPCDNCGGRLTNGTFQVVRTSIALVNPRKANEVLGMTQFFGGKIKLAEAMFDSDCVTVAMDHPDFKQLQTELFLCMDCYCRPVCMAEIVERKAEKQQEPA